MIDVSLMLSIFMNKNVKLCIYKDVLKYYLIFVCLLLFVGICQADVHAEQMVELLEGLSPLPKVHYYSQINGVYLNDYGNKILYEITRITHSVGISGEWSNEKQVDNCVYTCARLNKTNPEIKASLCISYSPWHRKFKKELPVTDRSKSYFEEILFFESRMKMIENWISRANFKYGTDVKVSMIKLDCERFYEKPNDDAWNEAMREALDVIHKKALDIFPMAKVQWYGRGIRRPDGVKWRKTPYFTGKEIKSPLSCSLYSVPEQEAMKETYVRTCKLADQLGIETVTPYVALGCGYRKGTIKKLYWDFEWDYDLSLSYELGSELNRMSSDDTKKYDFYQRAKYIMLYPPPFDKRAKFWLNNFVAYVQGATQQTDINNERKNNK